MLRKLLSLVGAIVVVTVGMQKLNNLASALNMKAIAVEKYQRVKDFVPMAKDTGVEVAWEPEKTAKPGGEVQADDQPPDQPPAQAAVAATSNDHEGQKTGGVGRDLGRLLEIDGSVLACLDEWFSRRTCEAAWGRPPVGNGEPLQILIGATSPCGLAAARHLAPPTSSEQKIGLTFPRLSVREALESMQTARLVCDEAGQPGIRTDPLVSHGGVDGDSSSSPTAKR